MTMALEAGKQFVIIIAQMADVGHWFMGSLVMDFQVSGLSRLTAQRMQVKSLLTGQAWHLQLDDAAWDWQCMLQIHVIAF